MEKSKRPAGTKPVKKNAGHNRTVSNARKGGNIDIPIVRQEKPRNNFSLLRTIALSLLLSAVAAVVVFTSKENKEFATPVDLKSDEIVSTQENILMPVVTEELSPIEIDDIDKSDSTVLALNREGVEFLREGKFKDGIEKFEEALLFSPKDEVSTKNLAHAHLKTGWDFYRGKEYEKALEKFEASLKATPTAQAYKGSGAVYMAKGDYVSAEASLEESLLLNDQDSNSHLLMGIVLYRENRLEDARNYLERVLGLDPGNAEAAGILSKIKRESIEDSFRNKESFHFHVKYEGAENGEVGHLVSLILEEAYHKVGSDLGFYPEDMISAILYTGRQFKDVTKSPSWSGGLYDGKIRLPVGGINERTEVLARVVYHEYTHAVIHRIASGNCPTWLNEGIAQLEEGDEGVERALKIIRANGRLVGLKNLEGSFLRLDSASASIAYAMSLLAADYIVREYGLTYIAAIMDELKSGKRAEEAVLSALYISYDEIEQGVQRRVEGG